MIISRVSRPTRKSWQLQYETIKNLTIYCLALTIADTILSQKNTVFIVTLKNFSFEVLKVKERSSTVASSH